MKCKFILAKSKKTIESKSRRRGGRREQFQSQIENDNLRSDLKSGDVCARAPAAIYTKEKVMKKWIDENFMEMVIPYSYSFICQTSNLLKIYILNNNYYT